MNIHVHHAKKILSNWSLGPAPLLSSVLNADARIYKKRSPRSHLKAVINIKGQGRDRAAFVKVAQVVIAVLAGANVKSPKKIRLGTRKSALALAQSKWVKKELETHWPEISVDLVKFTTKGDKILDVSLAKVGGKGLFVKEIEDALLREDADIAVHSLKDVPAELPAGLEVTVFPFREDPRDALISRTGLKLEDLPKGSRVGTSSLRRIVQLKNIRPDLEVANLRGNIDTRLRKLDEGHYDAIILAAAGLDRLGLKTRISQLLEPEVMLPAAGQGALGIEFRSMDKEVEFILTSIHHKPTAICVRAERAFLFKLGGGCQVPLGAFARLDGKTLRLECMVGNEAGTKIIKMNDQGTADQPETLGTILGEKVLAAGGAEILREIYGSN
jgi:hydroxymethylbilane synthase